ncbi:hypothetical protein ScalyP_jg2817 [Parmales sp. scaly parma]|nr:hypothetical protein ScalyP_jg2817 [Parmales sp. scaly parma]
MNQAAKESNFATLTGKKYLEQTKMKIYIQDSLLSILAVAETQTINFSQDSVHSRPFRFLSNYFENVTMQQQQQQLQQQQHSSSHVVNKPFNFIVSTHYNRLSFLKALMQFTKPFQNEVVTPDDFHQLLVTICPDFPRSVVHSVAWLAHGGSSAASYHKHKFAVLTRAFFFYFYNLEYFLQVQIFFASAYDGASGNGNGNGNGCGSVSGSGSGNGNGEGNSSSSKSIIMPPLLCDAVQSPLRELAECFSNESKTNPETGERIRASWKRAFGCSVEISHVVVALTRIENGCNAIGLPTMPTSIFSNKGEGNGSESENENEEDMNVEGGQPIDGDNDNDEDDDDGNDNDNDNDPVCVVDGNIADDADAASDAIHETTGNSNTESMAPKNTRSTTGQKVTLERLWVTLTTNPFFIKVYDQYNT